MGRNVGRWLGLPLVAALVVVRVWDPLPVEMLRLRTFDFYQALQPRQSPDQPVAIVDVDEESLAVHGQWPWPRTLIAELILKIARAGAVATAFDVVYPEPDRMSPENLADVLTSIDEAVRDQLREQPSNDEVLAQALRRHRVVVGQSGYHRAVGDLSRAVKTTPVGTLGGDPRPYLFKFPGLVRNVPELEEAALGRAMFTLLPERDGVVRRVPAMMTVGDVLTPALSLELLRVATGKDAFLIKTDQAGVRGIGVAGVEIPTDRNGRVWVHYAPHDRSKYISAKDILADPQPRGTIQRLAGKLIFIGTSATGLYDVRATPVEPAMPGVEIHAQLLETILTASHMNRPNNALGIEVSLTAFAGLLIVLFVPVLGAIYTFLLGAGMAGVLAAGSWYLYASERTLIDVTYPLTAGFLVYLVLVFVNYYREEIERRKVRGAFSQYLSPALVQQLASEPDSLVLGGETKEMSILFCDVRGFTTISETFKTDPQGLTRLMNRFLTPLTNEIVDHRGTIDKYMGDAIMAFWNAPLDDPHHAKNACSASLAMLDALDRLNRVREQEAADSGQQFVPLKIGVGINTGECVVGNFGSDMRFDYSVLGDSVNLASRLEGQSKTYGFEIVLGEATAEHVKDDFALLELDLIAVKGKHEPGLIYALVGDSEVAKDPGFLTLARHNQELMGCYRAQDWEGALTALAACRQGNAGVDLTRFLDLYEDRIHTFQATPPAADWDGVFVATTK